MATTVKDIALKSGVSASTVSRVLNNKADKFRISKKTEKLVLQTAEELNYRPNFLARSLRLKKTKTIGLIIPDISNPFFAHVTRMIQLAIYKSGYSLIVCNTDENIETEIEEIELLRSKGVDGFIILPVGTNYNHIEKLLQDKVPMVLLDRCFEQLETNAVVVDNFLGAYKAVQHIVENGHKRIAIIQGLPDTYTNTERLKGYRKALRDNGIRIDEKLIVGNDFRKENGYIETKFLLNIENPPTAIFTTSDLITLGALKAIFEEDAIIPEDISLVAFDEIEFAPFLVTPLTVVSQPKDLMGEIAVKILIDDIQGKTEIDKQRIVLKPKLIIRKSVATLNRPDKIQVLSGIKE